jgi:AcrR family transcriptional regulator
MVKQERAARTRRTLIRAAAEVFADEGFSPASLTAISRRAGVSNGALHFHFENKRLLADAVEEEAAAVLSRITEEAQSGREHVLQVLIDGTHGLTGSLATDMVLRGGFELAGDVSRRNRSPLRAQWRQWIEKTLKLAESGGSLAQGVSSGDSASAVVAATIGFEVLGTADGRWLARATLTRFWELMLPRLAAPGTLHELVSAGTWSPAGPDGALRVPAPVGRITDVAV